MFQKILVEIPEPLNLKEKHQSSLHAIGGYWYMNKFNEKLPSLKKRKLGKKTQEKDDEIKRNLQMENQNRKNWKFQHWNKLEWVNPRSHNEQKIPFCVSSKFFV